MNDEHTTGVVSLLDELAEESPAEPIIRALLDRAIRRLHLLCPSMLHRSTMNRKYVAVGLASNYGVMTRRLPNSSAAHSSRLGGLVENDPR